MNAHHCNRSQAAVVTHVSAALQGGPMRKTLLPLAGMLAAALLLTTACSGSDDDAAAEAPKPGEKVALTYWSWAPNMDKVVEIWNASHPDIQVTVNKQDGGDPAVAK